MFERSVCVCECPSGGSGAASVDGVVLAIVSAWLAGCGGGTSAGSSTQLATTVPPASLEQQ